MKKILSRRFAALTLVVILILSAVAFGGCYRISSAELKYVVGTYKLITYSGQEDLIAAKGIELYVVIRSDGTGYYAYKDSETAAHIKPVSCRYLEDEEEPGKYSYVEIDFEGNGDYEKLAIYSKMFEKKLNATKAVWKGNLFEGTARVDYTVSIVFERVSNATDLSYVNKHFK